MKKSTVSIALVSAILGVCLTLQSCAERTETTYSEPPYYTSSTYNSPYYTSYNTYPAYPETTTTYTTTTTASEPEHDSVVGSTAHAAGTIIAAPFRLVGDALSIVF